MRDKNEKIKGKDFETERRNQQEKDCDSNFHSSGVSYSNR
jgi:hypothetical protein